MDIYGGRRTRNWQGFLSDLSPTNNVSSVVTLRTTTTTTATTTCTVHCSRKVQRRAVLPTARLCISRSIVLRNGCEVVVTRKLPDEATRRTARETHRNSYVIRASTPVATLGYPFFFFFFCHRSTPSGRSSLTRRSATGTHNTWTSSKQLRWNVADNVYHGVRVITSFVNGYGQHAILCRSFYSTSCCLCYRVLISSQIFTFNRHRYRHAKLVGVPGGRHGRRQRIADTRDDGHETQVFVAGWRQTDDLLPAQVA